jgi:hypothetical protein
MILRISIGFGVSGTDLDEARYLLTSGDDYNVEIFTNPDFTDIQIVASSNSSSTSHSDFDEYFSTEQEAVEFLCNNFSNFKCL